MRNASEGGMTFVRRGGARGAVPVVERVAPSFQAATFLEAGEFARAFSEKKRCCWSRRPKKCALFARFERIWVCEHISAYIIVVMRNAQVFTQRPNVFEMKN